MTNTLSRETYDTLMSEAKAKANLIDNDVAVVIWDSKADGSTAFEVVACHRRFTGNDMTKVNELLEIHEDAEILEIVGADY
jgi:hypothetical protein